ncbi:MAG: four helix bundle protein [Chitinophagales bacterium]
MWLELKHKQFPVYEVSKQMLALCYGATKFFPKDEKFILTQQIRRAALSAFLNLAEGFSRNSLLERKRFYEISRSSIVEVEAAFEAAIYLGYCDKNDLFELGETVKLFFKQISALMNSMDRLHK